MNAAMTQAEKAAELASAVRWLLALLVLAAVVIVGQVNETRLVGLECEGAAGPLYAASESDFPICGQIRPR